MSDTPVGERAIGFFALDIAGIDKDDRSRIEVFPGVGTYVHPTSGKFELDQAKLAAFVADLNENGDKIQVDFDHSGANGRGTAAAGWFVPGSAAIEDGKVMADVDWTPEGAEAIRTKKYRFISPEFSFAFKDMAGNVVKKARLWAAALTNRPFFEQMQPVTLCDQGLAELMAPTARLISSEELELLHRVAEGPEREVYLSALQSFDDATREKTLAYLATLDKPKESDMDIKQLAASLGLAESATEEEVVAAAKQLAADKKAADDRLAASRRRSTNGGEMKLNQIAEALGLADDADEATVLAAIGAAHTASEKASALEEEVEGLRATASSSKKLEERLKVIEAERRAERVKATLESGVRAGKVLPSEKPELAKQFASNPDGLVALIASRPDHVFRLTELGSGQELDESIRHIAGDFESEHADGVDPDSAKLHVRAMQILRETNIRKPTADQYADALEQAYDAAR